MLKGFSRYQHPSVTFVTPIYHPNIDNGGRICLDILNLPPKGARQPSLNISIELTSIRLLLSEPNPDDGLMCEASREYKYNRQAFDQKARFMTEKYAKAGAGGNNCSTQGIQNLNPGITEFAGSEDSVFEVDELVLGHKKPCGISRKLSLECSSSIQSRDSDAMVNEKRNGHEKENVVQNQSSICRPPTIPTASSWSSVSQHNICNQQKHHCHQTNESMNGSIIMSSAQPYVLNQKKVSLETFLVRDGNNDKMLFVSQVLRSQTSSNSSHGSSSMVLLVNSNELQPRKDFIDGVGNGFTNTICKRVSSVGKKLSLGLKGSSQGREKDKENLLPIHKLPVSSPKSSSRKSGIWQKLSFGHLTQLQRSTDNNIQLLSQNLSMVAPMSLPLEHTSRM